MTATESYSVRKLARNANRENHAQLRDPCKHPSGQRRRGMQQVQKANAKRRHARASVPGAWEIIHKPKVRELSIVASPAYKDTAFAPVASAAAMNGDQWDAIVRALRIHSYRKITRMWVLSGDAART